MSLVYYFFGTQCISISRVSVLTRDKKSMNHIATVLIAYRLWSISTTQYTQTSGSSFHTYAPADD